MVLRPRNGISLCAGAGGLDLGLQLAEPGYATRCFVENDPHAQEALVAAMAPELFLQRNSTRSASCFSDLDPSLSVDPSFAGWDTGSLHTAPVWSNLRTFVGDAWRGHINIVCAGYPCQPFSAAGKRLGSDDPRHLWPDVARILVETGAEWGFFENVSGHISSVLRPCCETYGTWATRLRLAYSRRAKHSARTNGKGFSSWPTPMAGTPAQNGNAAAGNSHDRPTNHIFCRHDQGTDRRAQDTDAADHKDCRPLARLCGSARMHR